MTVTHLVLVDVRRDTDLVVLVEWVVVLVGGWVVLVDSADFADGGGGGGGGGALGFSVIAGGGVAG